jgi:phosphatidylglycerol lysyltransferase
VRPTPSIEQLTAWVEAHGAHTASYVLLEGDKRIVTAPAVDGFLAYERRACVPIVAGDPVCAPEQAAALLHALRRRVWPAPVLSYATRPEMLDACHHAGFGAVAIGAEPVFDPRTFTLAGGARATVRAAVNHARREGVTVIEHHPRKTGAERTNAELNDISSEWLAAKGGDELGFLLGQPQLDRWTRKRYFIARRQDHIEAFLVCEPVTVRHGWYLDVTRRRPDAPRGVMELLATTALETFGREGSAFASMGLAPLGLLDLGDAIAKDSSELRALLAKAFEVLDTPYDFRNLLRYKSKFAPDRWEPRFLCYTRGAGEHVLRMALRTAVRRARPRAPTPTSGDAASATPN